MTTRPKLFLAAALGMGCAALAPAGARADVYCVHPAAGTTGCNHTLPATGSLGNQLAAAIKQVASTAADDTIRLGDGSYDNKATFYYIAGQGKLTIEGTGISKVFLRDTATTADDETVEGRENSGALTVRNLTIEGPGKAVRSLGIELGRSGSLVEKVAFVAPTAPVTGALQTAIFARAGITVRDTTVTGFTGGILAIAGTPLAKITAQRVSVTVTGKGITENAGGGDLCRVTVRTSGGPFALSALGTTTVQNSVLDASSTTNSGVTTGCGGTTTMRYVTIRSRVVAACSTSGQSATSSVADSILVPGDLVTTSGSGHVNLTRLRWDGPASATGSVSQGAYLTIAQPMFVGASDFHLATGSPLIDRGVVTGSLTAEPYLGGDRAGSARVTDGNGDGVAKPDLGAYEAPKP